MDAIFWKKNTISSICCYHGKFCYNEFYGWFLSTGIQRAFNSTDVNKFEFEKELNDQIKMGLAL